jgi:hypothetical protein
MYIHNTIVCAHNWNMILSTPKCWNIGSIYHRKLIFWCFWMDIDKLVAISGIACSFCVSYYHF